MKAIIATLGLLIPTTHSQLTESQKVAILQQHNELRQQTAAGNTLCANGEYCPPAQSIPDLQWDDGLANLAQDYADSCAMSHEYWNVRSSRFQSLGGSTNFPGQYGTGENLAWGSCSLNFDGTCSATYRWGEDEATCWTYNENGGSSSCTTGHFTQMIWANTQYVGCGWRGGDCTSYGGMLVCNYYPPGNYNGQSPYTATTGQGSPVNPPLPTPSPTPAPVDPPAVVNPGDSGSSNSGTACISIENSAFGGYFDGKWSVGGTSEGRTYWTSDDGFVLEWASYHNGWAIKTGLGGQWYMHCSDEYFVTDCTAGKWVQSYGDVAKPATIAVATSCGTAFTNEEEGDGLNGETSSDGWKVVLVVVIVGLLLIAAGNVAWCMYMKKHMMPRHNMEKIYDEQEMAKNDETIEVNYEVTS